MNAKDVAEITSLQAKAKRLQREAPNSIIRHELKGMERAFNLMMLLARDAAGYAAESERLFGFLEDRTER